MATRLSLEQLYDLFASGFTDPIMAEHVLLVRRYQAEMHRLFAEIETMPPHQAERFCDMMERITRAAIVDHKEDLTLRCLKVLLCDLKDEQSTTRAANTAATYGSCNVLRALYLETGAVIDLETLTDAVKCVYTTSSWDTVQTVVEMLEDSPHGIFSDSEMQTTILECLLENKLCSKDDVERCLKDGARVDFQLWRSVCTKTQDEGFDETYINLLRPYMIKQHSFEDLQSMEKWALDYLEKGLALRYLQKEVHDVDAPSQNEQPKDKEEEEDDQAANDNSSSKRKRVDEATLCSALKEKVAKLSEQYGVSASSLVTKLQQLNKDGEL